MALILKNAPQSSYKLNQPVVEQYIHVARPTGTLPQTATQNLFQVTGGRIKVKALVGQVTTIIQSSDPVLKVSSTAKDNVGITVGTAIDIASTVDLSSLEVGGMVFVEGDGTAAVKSNAGAAFIGTNSGEWIAPQGFISITTGASKSGAIKWDLMYEPFDEAARVVAVPLAAGV